MHLAAPPCFGLWIRARTPQFPNQPTLSTDVLHLEGGGCDGQTKDCEPLLATGRYFNLRLYHPSHLNSSLTLDLQPPQDRDAPLRPFEWRMLFRCWLPSAGWARACCWKGTGQLAEGAPFHVLGSFRAHCFSAYSRARNRQAAWQASNFATMPGVLGHRARRNDSTIMFVLRPAGSFRMSSLQRRNFPTN